MLYALLIRLVIFELTHHAWQTLDRQILPMLYALLIRLVIFELTHHARPLLNPMFAPILQSQHNA